MFTKFDRDMYKTLKFIESYKTNELVNIKIKNNIMGSENYITHVFDQLIKNDYIEGIKVLPTMDSNKKLKINKNVYITSKGYTFMKQYKSRYKTIIVSFITIVITALVTVHINNWIGEKSKDCVCNCISQPNTKN